MQWLPLLLFFTLSPGAPSDRATIDFNRDIRPILFSRCVACHGPDDAARKAGLRLDTAEGARAALGDGVFAVVPGDAAASELLARVRATHPDDRMPPPEKGDPLAAEQIGLLEAWIEGGAEYARHWAWDPPRATEAPPRPDGSAATHAIDGFVEARARAAGLSFSPVADRQTLIRRLSLDLLGLPPRSEEINRFLADDRPDAWERLVDRTLASPRFGERWASVWLDLARYADTKGYEADRERTMWPWRDQVIRALNADQPFDAFTIEQIAGDLLHDPTEAQLLATGFHRNTMTNDEGGTDDEEFRVAAVLDRVDTTMQVWMGLTAGCAQCHSHKFDPITHREYYQLADVFNQTEDADRNDDAPTLEVLSDASRARRAELQVEIEAVQSKVREKLHLLALPESPPGPAPTPLETVEPFPVVANGITPAGAALVHDGRTGSWPWGAPTAAGAPSRPVVRTSTGPGSVTQVFFDRSYERRTVTAQDRWVAWAWLDPSAPPTTVMLQVHSEEGSWSHRAVWGEDAIELGAPGTAARRRVGDLPPTGVWTRLSVPVAKIGIAPGNRITGLALTHRGGTVEWAGVWHETSQPPDPRWSRSLGRFVAAMREDPHAPLPAELREILAVEDPDPSQMERVREHFWTEVHPDGREAFAPFAHRISELEKKIAEIDAKATRVPVMRERDEAERRTTHVLTVGNFLMPEIPVAAEVPAAWHPWPSAAPRDRLGFARWLVDPANPLTARVQVNRVWEQIFGRGLVETTEDFGTQGQLPSHPDLLDHLAIEFMADGWRGKALIRRIVLTETYRRSAVTTPKQLRRDPRNVLLARSSRTRLSAEVIRDQALAIGGILSDTLYGPPVFPPQPPGVWQVVYNGAQWQESVGEDRRRRSLYTYWRRTSPYPSALTFDAPSREICSARRIRTSTPLQALVLLNDPVYLEAAAGLGAILLEARASADLADAIAVGFRRATARVLDGAERAVLVRLYEQQQQEFSKTPAAARLLLEKAWPEGLADRSETEIIDFAALTVVAQVILNLDEVMVRP